MSRTTCSLVKSHPPVSDSGRESGGGGAARRTQRCAGCRSPIYIYIYIYMHTYVYVYTYIYIYTYIFMRTFGYCALSSQPHLGA